MSEQFHHFKSNKLSATNFQRDHGSMALKKALDECFIDTNINWSRIEMLLRKSKPEHLTEHVIGMVFRKIGESKEAQNFSFQRKIQKILSLDKEEEHNLHEKAFCNGGDGEKIEQVLSVLTDAIDKTSISTQTLAAILFGLRAIPIEHPQVKKIVHLFFESYINLGKSDRGIVVLCFSIVLQMSSIPSQYCQSMKNKFKEVLHAYPELISEYLYVLICAENYPDKDKDIEDAFGMFESFIESNVTLIEIPTLTSACIAYYAMERAIPKKLKKYYESTRNNRNTIASKKAVGLEHSVAIALHKIFPELTIKREYEGHMGFEYDIFIPELGLNIEIDGEAHLLSKSKNQRRDALLKDKLQITVERISLHEYLNRVHLQQTKVFFNELLEKIVSIIHVYLAKQDADKTALK